MVKAPMPGAVASASRATVTSSPGATVADSIPRLLTAADATEIKAIRPTTAASAATRPFAVLVILFLPPSKTFVCLPLLIRVTEQCRGWEAHHFPPPNAILVSLCRRGHPRPG